MPPLTHSSIGLEDEERLETLSLDIRRADADADDAIEKVTDKVWKWMTANAERQKQVITPDGSQLDWGKVRSAVPELASEIDQAEELKSKAESLRKERRRMLDSFPNTADGRRQPKKVAAAGGVTFFDEFVEHRGGMRADLLDPGTVPVTVPLRSQAVRQGEPVHSLLQVLDVVPAPTGRYSFMRQNTRTNNARTVAQGSKKPESVFTLERIDGRTKVVAHVSEPIDENDLKETEAGAGGSILRDFLNSELALGLILALENELVAGDGTSTGGTDRMTGFLNTSGIIAQAFSNDPFETARKAITALEDFRDLLPAVWVMTPTRWEAFELTTVGGEESYALDRNGQQRVPVDRAARRLWGVPVALISTDSGITDDRALLIADGAARVHMTEEATIRVDRGTKEDPNNPGTFISTFESNEVLFRAELKADLEVSKPFGVVDADLTAA